MVTSSQPPLRAHFDRELAGLIEKVLEMGSRSRQAVSQGMVALMTGNDELAREVIAGDTVINDMRFVIEKMCYGLLAMEQPVAGDLRAIVAALDDCQRSRAHRRSWQTHCRHRATDERRAAHRADGGSEAPFRSRPLHAQPRTDRRDLP